MIKVSILKTNPGNPRTIKGDKLELLKRSITEFEKMMVLRPIIVDENGIVLGGNMRLAAIKALGKKEIPDEWVKRATDLTEAEKREFIVKDNAGFGEWDWEILGTEWADEPLADWGLDLPDIETVAEAGTADAEPQIDKAAELNKKWKVKSGDLWLIGDHRLLCGDSTNHHHLDTLFDGMTAEMMFTDPPYGVNYEGGHFHSGDVHIKRERQKLVADETTAIYFDFLPIALAKVDGPCYMWFAGTKAGDVYNAVNQSGCEVHALLIWHKINATYAAMNAQYKQRHEPCLYFKPKGSTLRWCGASTEATLWELKKDGQNTFHPTQKPIELAMKALGNHEAKSVLDCFGGSGSTMVAAQNTSRKAYLCEISENYCAVILERMQTAFPDIEIRRG